MKLITIEQLLGPWRGEPWTPAELASGEHVCQAWNALGAAAESEGVILQVNPATGCHIGGTGNGGARPKGSKVGAPGSKHQLLLALDFFDPQRALMRWILSRGLEKAAALGMYFEHPQWTHSWVHGQILLSAGRRPLKGGHVSTGRRLEGIAQGSDSSRTATAMGCRWSRVQISPPRP
jgi:hypothetical protein